MDLLQMLNDNRHLKWGDPDNPEDDDAVVYLCWDAAQEIKNLRAAIEAKDAEIATVKDRARRAAQILIESIGAPGPENVDETAARAVDRIAEQDRIIKAWEEEKIRWAWDLNGEIVVDLLTSNGTYSTHTTPAEAYAALEKDGE